MKRKKILITLMVVLILISSITVLNTSLNAATKGFNVSGTKLLDANGTPFVMRGVNHAHTWYKDQLNTVIPTLAKAGCNTVRIVLSNGGQWTEDSAADVTKILDLCNKNKMIAVLEVHDATGSNDAQTLLKAANYFVKIKSAIEGKEDKVIINIANEWCGDSNTATWANGYKQAIPVIRKAGLKHTILVDCAGWGQYPTSIHEAGSDVLASDTEKNTMFAFHGYEYSAGTAQNIKDAIDKTISKNLCLIVGEFGWKHTSGNVDEDTILSYCQEKGIGWLAWSWKGNSGGVEYLDLSADWQGTKLSDWGNRVVNGTNGLKQTSKICSVFGK